MKLSDWLVSTSSIPPENIQEVYDSLFPTPVKGTSWRYKKSPIPKELRDEVFKRDGYSCKHCGSRDFLSADHIYPERLGGITELNNLQTLCKSCNSKKGITIL